MNKLFMTFAVFSFYSNFSSALTMEIDPGLKGQIKTQGDIEISKVSAGISINWCYFDGLDTRSGSPFWDCHKTDYSNPDQSIEVSFSEEASYEESHKSYKTYSFETLESARTTKTNNYSMYQNLSNCNFSLSIAVVDSKGREYEKSTAISFGRNVEDCSNKNKVTKAAQNMLDGANLKASLIGGELLISRQ